GIAVGWWIFRAVRSDRRVSGADAPDSIDQPKQRLIRDGVDTIEGRGLADEVGAAARDVAGEILGVDAHLDLPSPAGPPDNLQTLKGVGPKLASQLNANGITRFDQLAALSANEVEILDSSMGASRRRLCSDAMSLSILWPSISTTSNCQPPWLNLSPTSGIWRRTDKAKPATVE